MKLLALLLATIVVAPLHAFLLPLPPHAPRAPPQGSTSTKPREIRQHASTNNGGGGGSGLVEGFFKFVRSDALSLGVGSLALLVLVTNRLYTDPLFDSQSRTDILGVFSAGGLLLNGLTLQVTTLESGGGSSTVANPKCIYSHASSTHPLHPPTHQDITVREADTIELQGAQVDDADLQTLSARQATVLRWAADTYLETLANTKSVLVWHNDLTVLRKGTMPSNSGGGPGAVEIKAIVQKALSFPAERDGLSQPTYIPDLQVLPGKVEFTTYLPELCQAVVLQPFDNNKGLVVLGANKRRALTPKDLAKARVVAQKVQSCLAE